MSSRGIGGSIPTSVAYALGAASLLLLASLVFSGRRRAARSRRPVADPGGGITTLVEVQPPSVSGETAGVVRLAGAIVCGALFVIALDSRSTPDTDRMAPDALTAFQVRFEDLSPSVQQVFRELIEAVREIERVRSATRSWPSATSLTTQGIPPFASSAIDADGYSWTFRADAGRVNYRGVPAPGSRAPTYLVLIEERGTDDPSLTAPDGSPIGESHRLSDGTRLRVSMWFRPAGVVPVDDAMVIQPITEGWTPIVAGASAEAAAR